MSKYGSTMNLVVPSNVLQYKIAPQFIGNPQDDPMFMKASTKRGNKVLDLYTDPNAGLPGRYAIQPYNDQDGAYSMRQIDWEKVSAEQNPTSVFPALPR